MAGAEEIDKSMELEASTIEDARMGMHGRILRCPLGGNPEDCPLHEVRKWPLEERIAWLESKTNQEIVELYQQHVHCLEQKLAEQFN
jgi:hypothetical protein